MIDFTALLHRAEGELLDDEALVRTVKTGILFGTLMTTLQHYSKVQFGNTDGLALLEILARHGKLYDGLQLSELRSKLASTNGDARAASGTNGHAPLRVQNGDNEQSVPDLLFEKADVRAAVKSAYPTFTDAEIEALMTAHAQTQGAGVVARTDEELALYEAEKNNPFPGAPLGKPLNDFTMTDNVEIPSDLKPLDS